MEKQISIIIPTYNMEAYIGKCLDSLLIPEFDQVEVLVVNDGSKDRSSEIAHEYANRYPDSIRVIDKENGNYGSCINAALPLCTGRYIKVLDADDTFDTIEFSKFVRLLPECNEDAIITNHIIVDPDGHELQRSSIPHQVKINQQLSVEEATFTICSSYLQMHRITYNRDVFTRFSYHQTEGVSYTDSQWSIIPISYCHNFRCIDLIVYRYLLGRDGQTMSSEQLSRFLNQFFTVMSDTLKHFRKCQQHKNMVNLDMITRHITENHEYVYFQVLRDYNRESIALLKEHDVKLKKLAPEIYEKLNKTQYTQEIDFPVIKYIREKKYPEKFSLPIFKRIELIAKVRLRKIFDKK